MTLITLVIAVGISSVGVLMADRSSKFGLGVDTFALLAAISGIYAERRAASKLRLHQALASIASELRKNALILDDPRFAAPDGSDRGRRIFPRLLLSATDVALISGALIYAADQELMELLHQWRDLAAEFNRRLEVTELRLFTGAGSSEVASLDRALHRSGGYLDSVHEHVNNLLAYLCQRYPKEARETRGA